jgi:hypothetical protein
MDPLLTSSIAIGDEEGFDLVGPMVFRYNTNDDYYPVSLEGETIGGYDVSISLTYEDAQRLADFLSTF